MTLPNKETKPLIKLTPMKVEGYAGKELLYTESVYECSGGGSKAFGTSPKKAFWEWASVRRPL